ncbi:NAD(P)-binding protein [Ectobacillus panaciterrae]|uniref:NAD(P)-binding protein n=1 Tax=Ectobacillus panaciterrae TaxID=363872 RepID=UPI000418388E|nr:NAD(P)-binding protein [Ectobacillus panaciterrae]
MYPITLRIEGKKAAIAGGGKIAYFKIGPLLEAGADVTVISPEIDRKIQELVTSRQVKWVQKEYERADVEDAFLIIAATDNKEINERIEEEAGENQLVNVISDPTRGNCHFPAALKQGKLLIAVSTGGASPKLAKQIRNELKNVYDETYEEYLEFLNECRVQIKRLNYDKAARHKLLQQILQDEYRTSVKKRIEFLNSLV